MNATEARSILTILGLNYERTINDGLPAIWAATLGDIDFKLGRDAALEMIRTKPFMPNVAEIRERARLIREQRQRDERRARQLAGVVDPPPVNSGRTGRAIVQHVLGRLADAGQDIAAGKYLGRQRAADIAEEAVREWLATVDERPQTTVPASLSACARCFSPHTAPSGSTCSRCEAPEVPDA